MKYAVAGLKSKEKGVVLLRPRMGGVSKRGNVPCATPPKEKKNCSVKLIIKLPFCGQASSQQKGPRETVFGDGKRKGKEGRWPPARRKKRRKLVIIEPRGGEERILSSSLRNKRKGGREGGEKDLAKRKGGGGTFER